MPKRRVFRPQSQTRRIRPVWYIVGSLIIFYLIMKLFLYQYISDILNPASAINTEQYNANRYNNKEYGSNSKSLRGSLSTSNTFNNNNNGNGNNNNNDNGNGNSNEENEQFHKPKNNAATNTDITTDNIFKHTTKYMHKNSKLIELNKYKDRRSCYLVVIAPAGKCVCVYVCMCVCVCMCKIMMII